MQPTIISVETAATQLGLSVSRTREICNAHNIGWFVAGIRDRLMTQADVKRIAAARRPRGPRPSAKKAANVG